MSKFILYLFLFLSLTCFGQRRAQIFGDAAFTPASISGCVFWIDPNNNSSITQSGGTASQINDQCGNGNNFVQAVGIKQPAVTASAINGKQALTYVAADVMSRTLAGGAQTAFSLFVLAQSSLNVQFNGIFGHAGVTGDLELEEGPTNSVDVYVNNVGQTTSSGNNTFNASTPYLIGVTYSTPNMVIYLNNVSKATPSTASRQLAAIMDIGLTPGFTGFQGIIGDVVLYNSVLSSTDRNNLYNNYMKTKWGLP